MRHFTVSRLLLPAVAAAGLGPAAIAQQPDQDAGFGALKRTFNMTDVAGSLPDTAPDEDIRGVVSINGLLYLAGTNGDADDDHRVYVVDPDTTTLMGWFSLPEPHQSSVHGALGLDRDCSGNIIAAGAEGVAAFDTAGNQLDHIDVCNGTAADAVQSIPLPMDGNGDPVVEAPGEVEYCGVALDEEGDGGTGSLWIAECDPIEDVPRAIFELRISDGTVLQEFPTVGFTTNALVLDPLTGNFWTNSDNPFAIIELDGDLLTPTGRAMAQVPAQPGMGLSVGFGGMTLIPGGDPAAPWDSWMDLVSVSQQRRLDSSRKDDFVGFHRLHQYAGVPGYEESFLAGSVDGDPLLPTSPILFAPGDTLNWVIEHNNRGNFGLPAMNIINLGPDALIDGTTDQGILGLLGFFPELVALSPISQPPVPVAMLQPTAVGGSAVPPFGFVTSVPLAPTFPAATGDVIRLQSIYSDPGLPPSNLAASNELWFVALVPGDVMFEMEAPSAYTVNLPDGFVRLRENSGGGVDKSIVKLIIDLRAPATLNPSYFFDVTAGSMLDIFAAGNGAMIGCSGTYRGGSDVTTGLIYADGLLFPHINTQYNLGRPGVLGIQDAAGHPVCYRELWPDPGATAFPYQSGFLATNADNAEDLVFPTRLEFNFAPDMFLDGTFRFDVDIDGGPDSGGDLAGTYVEVHLKDGTVFTGTTLPDGTNPDRSVIRW